ncbi:hypothetical protein [Halobacterium salinarum]|uniref:hypothetical protein n=1 Tax=Halobacterium salinarum TaxID=2242 RepID=UPI002552251D|nr:hypothetical protein [Halobacterium salinarum]MDL0145478.1 hypothetical protein [Halobacterium salinarum]
MNRREYVKAVASLPVVVSGIPGVSAEEVQEETEEEDEWTVRGVWKRRDDTGLLHVRESGEELEFDQYNNWVTETIERVSEEADTPHVVNLFDYRLISLYDGSYARSHFTHDEAELEVTIKREPEEEVEYSAFVRSVDETWEEGREYASSSQIRLAQKLKRERDEYL